MSKTIVARSIVTFVQAVPMTRQEYNDLRGWQLPENENGDDAGFLVEDQEGQKNTPQYEGFVQWLPNDEFERKFIVENADTQLPKFLDSSNFKDAPTATVDFGSAIWALKRGEKVARSGWNGKGMWLMLVPTVVADKVTSQYEALDSLPWIGMKTADDKFVPWLASQTDVLAEDWIILE